MDFFYPIEMEDILKFVKSEENIFNFKIKENKDYNVGMTVDGDFDFTICTNTL